MSTDQAETVFEMGQRVNVYTEEDRWICVGEIDGIHHPDSPGGEEFYDVKPLADNGSGRPIFAHIDRISEMRLTHA